MTIILETQKISKSFGNLHALQNVDLAIEQKEIFGIVGPNGAGKSTLFNVIAGYYPPSSGKILFNGHDTTHLGAHKVCHLGLARTFQVPVTFKTLSVYENIQVGATFNNMKVKNVDQTIEKVISFLNLESFRNIEASHLDLYTTKLVMLGACLATDCTLLMLDEPLAGLAINEIDDFMTVIRNINSEAEITVIMIEHILDKLIEISHRMLVLHSGEVIFTGPPDKVYEDQQVIECYLGKTEEVS
jgi:branched-chain amino acid transport system ATP-binding protein